MPRIRRSGWHAETARLQRQVDHMSNQRVRDVLKSFINGLEEVHWHWDRLVHGDGESRRGDEVDIHDMAGYCETEIHRRIIDGHATRADIEAYINDTRNHTAETAIVMLVELGLDLILHHSRWTEVDLNALHAKIQNALIKELRDDVWVEDDTCDRMDELVDDARYSELLNKLDYDQRVLQNRDWTEHEKWVDRSGGGGSGKQ